MNEIVIKGTQEFMGISIPVVYGGFGEGQKVVTAKSVAEIHGMRLSDVNASINRLIKRGRIKDNVDYINFLSETVSLRDMACKLGLLDSNRTKDAFILSQRGYSKLIKAMDDDTSWDVMENFIDEYFRMKEHIETSASPILSTHDYMALIKHMEEREQRHYDTMMSMFKSFESSMRNLAGILITQSNTNVSTDQMIKESKSNYTKKGKKYRAEVIDLCQQIVAISDFEDENAVLSACYKHLNKNYGIVWEQEIREWKEQHAWTGKVSPLNVISESDDGKYLKSMLKNILMQILDDCKKNRVTAASESENNSEEVVTTVSEPDEIHTSMVATDFDSACEVVKKIAEQSGDKSPYNAVTFMRVYKSMDDFANISWDYHERKYRQAHRFPKSARVSKKRMINESSKLQKLFVAAVNKYMEEIGNAK